MSHFQAQGSVLITGDLNARTGEELDFISTEGDSYITGTNLDFPILPNRNNYGLCLHGERTNTSIRSLCI